jgi:16S rRNA (cytosine1402-N4)-methyltransferase
VSGNFRDLDKVLASMGGVKLDGILLDLGISSLHVDEAGRGFSFQQDGPLDMRMNPRAGATAAEILTTWSEEELAQLFREYGEEPKARRVARAIVEERVRHPFERTGRLADFLEKLLGRHGGRHPGTRVFQALRMAVNDEPGALRGALEAAPQWLKPGGRFAVITFQSLEDREVKHDFRERSRAMLDDPSWPEPRPNPRCVYASPLPKSRVPGNAEVARNRRSRSARLRVAERIPTPDRA